MIKGLRPVWRGCDIIFTVHEGMSEQEVQSSAH